MTVQRIIGSETAGNAVSIGLDPGQIIDSGVKTGAANGPVLFANLPVSPTVGLMYGVSDATTQTWGAAVTQGGGGYMVFIWWNGTNWTVIGK